MIRQVLLAKRLFLEGTGYAKRPDAVSCGVAISMFQDAAETLVWALIKARSIRVDDNFTFTRNLSVLQDNGLAIPEAPRLLELNKARVGFKHYGNLPAPDEARKYQGYVEDFLRSAVANQFGEDIDRLSLVDLVSFEDVRVHLKSAEACVEKGDLEGAVREASIAKAILFGKVAKYIPEVKQDTIEVGDRVFQHNALRVDFGGLHVFDAIAAYLDVLRDLSMVALLRMPLDDYAFLEATLFKARRYGDGKWDTVIPFRTMKCDEGMCKRQISCLVDISIRLEGEA